MRDLRIRSNDATRPRARGRRLGSWQYWPWAAQRAPASSSITKVEEPAGLPIGATARLLPDLNANVTVVEVDGAPHGLAWTHPAEVNRAILAFLEN